ncbi:MAG: FKBP-type peptidyl-prolyl cis-trans isomerase [Cyclobacteriaceae bacterium]
MKNLVILFIAVLLISACESNNNDFVTETGVEVSCLIKGEGSMPLKDSIVLLHLKITKDDGEVITETQPGQPMGVAFDPEMDAGDLQEVLTNLEVGDSVIFETTVQNLFVETYKTRVPPLMDSAAVLTVNVRFADQMSPEAYRAYMTELREKQQAESEILLAERAVTDLEEIDAYLAENNIEAQIAESGLRYVVEKQGTGESIVPGDEVTVHYAGRLLDGTYFDTSMEDVAKAQGLYDERRAPYQPFTFSIGRRQVIDGWDQGIPLFNVGGKGTLYIPSPMGYGSRQSGPVIKPYSILVFDVEVISVKKN